MVEKENFKKHIIKEMTFLKMDIACKTADDSEFRKGYWQAVEDLKNKLETI